MGTKTKGLFSKKERRWRDELKRLPWLLLIPAGLLLPGFLAKHPDAVESVYSGKIYPFLAKLFVTLNSKLAFSVTEFVIMGLIVGAVVAVMLWFVRSGNKSRILLRLFRLAVSLGITAGIMLNLFYALWGCNYFRKDLSELMQLDVKERSVEELEHLCEKLAQDAVLLREQVAEDEQGVYKIADVDAAFLSLPDAYEKLMATYTVFGGTVGVAKQVKVSKLMSHAGIAGIYIPYMFEPNVNAHQDDLLLISSAAHEMAHQLGFAHEDEANFISYLACMSSDDPAVRYSGTMLALITAANRLYQNDSEAYYELYGGYSDGMIRDLKYHSQYWKAFEGKTRETFDNINDSYLKFNQQETGVQSYGEMVDLLLAYYQP